MKRVTVHDVAAEAGVSLATVDRVLNRRPGVRAATVGRVMDAVDRLGYQRDMFAANLAKGRDFRFCFVLPDNHANTFLKTLHAEALASAERLAPQRTLLSVLEYPAFNEAGLARVLEGLDPSNCMGAAIVALDTPMVAEAINALIRKGIGVVTLVSDVTPARGLHSVGINNMAAGRVAGSLMGRFIGRRPGKVALIAGSLVLRDHVERRLGFEQTLMRDFPGLQILPVEEGFDDSAVTPAITERLLRDHPDLVGLYSMGAGNRGIIRALEASGRGKDIVVIAHELTSHSRRALISGTFDAVINQCTADEVRYALDCLRAHCEGNTAFVPPNVRIDVIFRDNIPY
ncbi:LacI family DNA-binding transcriptional regulator [Azospirillum sp. SYSU D00513]|uniref:LacI family DNA-binding transcriptional regulator n=1 Tax=Azospirillum sp. SYSU D00513 TaxID=2812561 RepID=UPI001A97ACBF|nr:LacI family DNA-binding transcriptional regulator [Azospirillum sp. SYSU D00513]